MKFSWSIPNLKYFANSQNILDIKLPLKNNSSYPLDNEDFSRLFLSLGWHSLGNKSVLCTLTKGCSLLLTQVITSSTVKEWLDKARVEGSIPQFTIDDIRKSEIRVLSDLNFEVILDLIIVLHERTWLKTRFFFHLWIEYSLLSGQKRKVPLF